MSKLIPLRFHCPGQCMDLHAFLLILFLSSILLCHGGIEGDSDLELSEKEDPELEKQLKLLNKPAVQTIQYTFL